MNPSTTLNEYLTRITLMQVECVPDSRAYPGVSTSTGNPLFWTNRVTNLVSTRLDPTLAKYDVTVEMILHRDSMTSGVDLEKEALCYLDILTVIDYFDEYPSLVTSTIPEPPLGVIPDSAKAVSNGVGLFPRGEVTLWGSGYTLTFSFMHLHFPRT